MSPSRHAAKRLLASFMLSCTSTELRCLAGRHATERTPAALPFLLHAFTDPKNPIPGRSLLKNTPFGRKEKLSQFPYGHVSFTCHIHASRVNPDDDTTRNATAVDFRLEKGDALQKFKDWAGGHWLGPLSGPGGEEKGWRSWLRVLEQVEEPWENVKVNAKLEPFWVFDVQVTTQFTGIVGFEYSDSQYNAYSRRWETQRGTAWRRVNSVHMQQSRYPNIDPDMQIYASYRHRQSDMRPLRGPHVSFAVPLTSELLRGGRELEPFEMRREIAWQRAREKVQKGEEERAGASLKQTYNADSVRGLELQIAVERVSARAIFLPAFIIEYMHADSILRAVVNGVTGEVGGEKHYSGLKVGAMVASGLTAASLLGKALGIGLRLGGALWGAVIAGVAVVAGWVVERWLPRLRTWLKDWQHSREVFEDAQRGSKSEQHFTEEDEKRTNKGQRFSGEDEEAEEAQRREQFQRQWRYQHWRFGPGAGRRSSPQQESFDEAWQRIIEEMDRVWGREFGGPFEGGPSGVPPGWENQRQRQQQYQQGGYQQQQTPRPSYRTEDPQGYYAALGATTQATEAEIKAAFRKLALEYHPDRHQGDEVAKKRAGEKFKKVTQAYQVLRDPQKRARYDAGEML